MHDDQLERRLSAALRREGDDLPFTITAAELERRLILRGRLTTGRRSTLLLAAAVGIGLLGVGGVVGGLLGDVTETAPPSQVADASPSSTDPVNLGSLDEVIDVAIGSEVVMAQARDHVDVGGNVPADALPELASMSLGTITGSSRYQLTLACLGDGAAALDIRLPGSRGPRSGPEVACDGAFYTQPIVADEPREIGLVAPRLASWRLVIRRLEGDEPDPPGSGPPLLEIPPGNQELVRVDEQVILGTAPTWGDSGLPLQKVGGLPARWQYATHASCVGGESVRLIVGHELGDGTLAATSETLFPCDNRIHDAWIGMPGPYGSDVYVAAPPEARWSILVSGEAPPIATAQDRPGWQMQVGFGPHLEFDPMEQRTSAPGIDGGGLVLVVVACAGTSPIEVTVDLGRRVDVRQETFDVACTPDGAETGQTFDVNGSNVTLTYAAPVGTWTAISILVPDPLPEGG
jgi:hypothetical protein